MSSKKTQKVVDLEETKKAPVEEEKTEEVLEGKVVETPIDEKPKKWKSLLTKIGIVGAIGATIGAIAYFGGKSSGEAEYYRALSEKEDDDSEEKSEEESDGEEQDETKIVEF